MSASPTPGWYADPQGLSAYRWWDGLSWTSHTSDGQPAKPLTQQNFYGGAVTAAPPQQSQFQQTPFQQNQFRPAQASSSTQPNQYAFITMGIVALYVLIAWKAHVYVLGILPVMMSIRSKSRGEPLAPIAIAAAAVAILVAIVGLTHH